MTAQTYNPDPGTRGLSRRECRNCGEFGFEHEKERVSTSNGRYSYNLVCP